MPLLELQGVWKRFRRGRDQVAALAAVDLAVNQGESVAIVGPSGAGKSTLLRVAGGLDVPDDGAVRLGGRPLSWLSAAERAAVRRRELGFVFARFKLIPTLTVTENVALPLLLDGRRDDGRVRSVVAQLGLTSEADYYPEELSAGEMQRTAIARALVAQPKLVLADEPTASLDSATSAEVLDALLESAAVEGAALLVVTDDPDAASGVARLLFMRDGRLDEALDEGLTAIP